MFIVGTWKSFKFRVEDELDFIVKIAYFVHSFSFHVMFYFELFFVCVR